MPLPVRATGRDHSRRRPDRGAAAIQPADAGASSGRAITKSSITLDSSPGAGLRPVGLHLEMQFAGCQRKAPPTAAGPGCGGGGVRQRRFLRRAARNRPPGRSWRLGFAVPACPRHIKPPIPFLFIAPAVSDRASFRRSLAATPLPCSSPSALRKPGPRSLSDLGVRKRNGGRARTDFDDFDAPIGNR